MASMQEYCELLSTTQLQAILLEILHQPVFC